MHINYYHVNKNDKLIFHRIIAFCIYGDEYQERMKFKNSVKTKQKNAHKIANINKNKIFFTRRKRNGSFKFGSVSYYMCMSYGNASKSI